MAQQYVEEADGLFRVSGTRVSLDSIVQAFVDCHSPETIAQFFPC